jgi:NADH-quinone oxidoreductase subunit N
MTFTQFLSEISPLAPEFILALGTMAMMIVGAFSRGGGLRTVSILSLILWAAAGVYVWMGGADELRVFDDMLILDNFARVLKTMVIGGAFAALMAALHDLKGTIMARFEYPVLMGFSTLGLMLMISANDLLSLYVGLELSSLALYVMAAFNRNSPESSEAGLKYFVLGAISSGLLLFGASLLYGYTGSTQFDVIGATLAAAAMPGPTPVIVVFGMVMVLAGITFKVAAVPFHIWTPDVYDGAPTPVTAFFAIAPKVGAMALLIRLVTGPFEQLTGDWQPIVTFMAVASMIVGAFAAIVQTNIKRLLAYSSIGNIGYALIGVVTATHFGLASVVLYMLIYMVTSAGTFGIILLLRKQGQSITRISDFAGLSKTHPTLAYGMAAMMFSMSGIPPLAGFFSKLAVFQAAVAAHFYVLAVIGVVSSVVAAWYYLNVIRVMFFEDGEGDVQVANAPAALVITGLSLAFVAAFILMPGPVSTLTANATVGLLP